jgi:hypothetical protein
MANMISSKSNIQEWISELNNSYINLNGPTVYVFKMDKSETDIDDLYGGENFGGSRIYLPPFKIRSIYLEKQWSQNLGTDTFPYLEIQEDAVFTVNFDNMVRIIRDLKHLYNSEIIIEHLGNIPVSARKEGDIFELISGESSIITLNLNDSRYRTTKKLADEINSMGGNYKVTLVGENDLSTNLVNFRKTYFTRKSISIFSEDETYKNCTDIIEKGDLILTDKFFLYEVHSNIPSGNIGWEYSTLTITGNVRSLDKVELPNNWNDLIARREYGLRDKINLE